MTHSESTTVAISGGGPAGIVLGLLLARAGIDVTVLEKHADFLRDFRGDTVHPSTLEVLDELGLSEELERLPHRKVSSLRLGNAEQLIVEADLNDLPGRYHHIAMVPQWDFLGMLVERARRYPGFRLLMNAESTSTIEEDGAVRGLRYRPRDSEDPAEEHELRAVLTVSADGRHSGLREAAGLIPVESGAPMDVLWFRLSRSETDTSGLNGRIGKGAMVVAIDRGDYWQMAYIIPKDGFEELRTRPITDLRETLAELLPFTADKVHELGGWDDVAFLKVGLNRLDRWHRPGYLCIGDAAHAMTPLGGVGINLAVQDAVATANLLAEPLLRAQAAPDRFERTLNPGLLARVRNRRWMPTVGTQAFQKVLQRQVVARALTDDPSLPPPLRLVAGTRFWSRLVARVMMRGLRPEHVRTPEVPVTEADQAPA